MENITTYAICLVSKAMKMGSEKMTISLVGLNYQGKKIGDWEIVVKKVKKKKINA